MRLEGASAGSAGLEGPLTSKKGLIRKMATEHPGKLLLSGLEGFKADLIQITDEVDENQSLQPVAVAWYRSVFQPNHTGLNEGDKREILTYCKLIDHCLRGETVTALDMIMQRLKAKVLATEDGHWQSAQHLELLPTAKAAGILSMGEEEFVRRVNAGEIRLADLLEKLRDSGSKSSTS